MSALVFCDTETNGTADQHELFEIALVRREVAVETTHVFWIDLSPEALVLADPKALEINRYFDRLAQRQALGLVSDDPAMVAQSVGEIFAGDPMIGLNPGFDARFLSRFLAHHGRPTQPWHYTPVCVKSMIAGKLGIAPPWRSDDLARALGVEPDAGVRHGALYDTRLTAALYDRVLDR
jgi:hypothetical protein